MSEQLSISRRDALMAATVAGAMAGVSNAQKYDPEGKQPSTKPLKVKITLTDGQVLNLTVTEAVIQFENGGALTATSTGILPLGTEPDRSPYGQDDSQPVPPRRSKPEAFDSAVDPTRKPVPETDTLPKY